MYEKLSSPFIYFFLLSFVFLRLWKRDSLQHKPQASKQKQSMTDW